jgi:hypothetical protein
MWPGRSQERRPAAEGVVDAAFFTFSAVAAMWLGYLLLRDGARPGWPALLLVVFWVFFTYLLLPRLHRVLTRLYVPNYFLGRARTSDGLLGDPVNIALLGDEGQVRASLERAGWVQADDVSVRSSARIVGDTLRRRSYPEAPVSPLHLFDRQQDFAYQQEVAGTPSQRHHVRFWRCPEEWLLPGGHRADWLAAASYDRRVGVSLFTLQVTHRIDGDTDVERDFVVGTVREANPACEVRVVRNFSTGYHARNGGGDRIDTDGDLPFVDLRATPPRDIGPRPTDSRDRRPAQTVFGAAVAIARAVMYIAGAVVLLLDAHFFARNARRVGVDLPREQLQDLAPWVAAVLLVAAVADLVLARAVLRGRNWARLVLMSGSVLTSVLAFVGQVRGTDPVALRDLPTLAASILVLLALSSHQAREFATSQQSRER